MTKPEKARLVENHLIQMARSGQLMGKVILITYFINKVKDIKQKMVALITDNTSQSQIYFHE